MGVKSRPPRKGLTSGTPLSFQKAAPTSWSPRGSPPGETRRGLQIKAIPCQSRRRPPALQLRTHKKPTGAKPSVHTTPKRREPASLGTHEPSRDTNCAQTLRGLLSYLQAPLLPRIFPGLFTPDATDCRGAEDEALLAERTAGVSGLPLASGRRRQPRRSRRGAGKDRNLPRALPGHPHRSPSVPGWGACHLSLRPAALGTPALLACSSSFPTGAQGARL